MRNKSKAGRLTYLCGVPAQCSDFIELLAFERLETRRSPTSILKAHDLVYRSSHGHKELEATQVPIIYQCNVCFRIYEVLPSLNRIVRSLANGGPFA